MPGRDSWMDLWSLKACMHSGPEGVGQKTSHREAVLLGMHHTVCLPAPAAWSEATPRPGLVLWAISVTCVTALSCLPPCDSGTWPIHRMSAAWFSSVGLLMMEGAQRDNCCLLKGCKNESSDSTIFSWRCLGKLEVRYSRALHLTAVCQMHVSWF